MNYMQTSYQNSLNYVAAFGSAMPTRAWTDESRGYRYGFNGYEKDDEIKGVGNSLDYGARIYDSRIGRFLSTDPDFKKYLFWSTYVYATNNPIVFIDIYGEGPKIKIKDVTSVFSSTTTGSTFKVTIYVKQPGAGGDRDAWENISDIDVGHTFIKLTQINPDGSQIERIFGFYPNNSVDLDNPEGLSTFRDDNNHDYTVSIEFSVDATKFQKTLDYLNSMEGEKYNLNTQNCTDIGLGCADASGNKLPDTQGTWGYWLGKSGGGSNPGDLGEDIRTLPGANTTPGKATEVNRSAPPITPATLPTPPGTMGPAPAPTPAPTPTPAPAPAPEKKIKQNSK